MTAGQPKPLANRNMVEIAYVCEHCGTTTKRMLKGEASKARQNKSPGLVQSQWPGLSLLSARAGAEGEKATSVTPFRIVAGHQNRSCVAFLHAI